MRRGFSWLVGTFAVGLACSWTTGARACACCDRASWQRVSGWDETGNALVDALENPGCAPIRRLEVWRDGAPEPKECVDLSDPNGTVGDCSEMFGTTYRTEILWSPLRRSYGAPVRILKADFVRATLEGFSGDDGYPRWHLRLFVFVEGSFRLLYETDVASGFGASGVGIENIGVGVFPSPDGERGLVLVDGFDTQPGLGDYRSRLAWVDLPEGLAKESELVPWAVHADVRSRTIRDTAAAVDGSVARPRVRFAGGPPRIAVASPRPRAEGEEEVDCASGKRAEAARQTARAVSEYAQCLLTTPWNADVRRALAGMFARLGFARHAAAEAHAAGPP